MHQSACVHIHPIVLIGNLIHQISVLYHFENFVAMSTSRVYDSKVYVIKFRAGGVMVEYIPCLQSGSRNDGQPVEWFSKPPNKALEGQMNARGFLSCSVYGAPKRDVDLDHYDS